MTKLEETYAILQEKLAETGITSPGGTEIIDIYIVEELGIVAGLDVDGQSWILN